ncbi:MAG: endonuclease III [Thermoplasmata archaeon]|nr:endonuclease III [Euryarchaeota archaeon]RLF65243.1 MAG: endonuclease III [Thermoplasmata archaeon]
MKNYMISWKTIESALKDIQINNSLFVVSHARNPFEILVSVILSQNTNDKNAIKALNKLKKHLKKITPEIIIKCKEKFLEDCIRPSGMQKEKTKTIIRAAKAFVDIGGEEAFLKLDPNAAREFLLGIKGIGKKTADVVLMVTHKADVFPVDTHIRRITQRLGIVHSGNYDEISAVWKKIVPKDLYYTYHKKLIEFGRRVCRARNPLCELCALRDLCRYYQKMRNTIEELQEKCSTISKVLR